MLSIENMVQMVESRLSEPERAGRRDEARATRDRFYNLIDQYPHIQTAVVLWLEDGDLAKVERILSEELNLVAPHSIDAVMIGDARPCLVYEISGHGNGSGKEGVFRVNMNSDPGKTFAYFRYFESRMQEGDFADDRMNTAIARVLEQVKPLAITDGCGQDLDKFYVKRD